MAHAEERNQVDVIFDLQLLQDVECAIGDAAVWGIRETLGEHEDAWSS